MSHYDIKKAFRTAIKECKGKRMKTHEVSAILTRSRELAVRKSKIDDILAFMSLMD